MKSLSVRAILLALTPLLTFPISAQTKPKVVHVFVALADNAHQGIVPVPAALGNGDDPDRNLYWGAAFGVKTFFERSRDWLPLGAPERNPSHQILERATFVHVKTRTILIADAYRGSEIKQALNDYFSAAAGKEKTVTFNTLEKDGRTTSAELKADLVVYVGHDGLMDFALEKAYPGEETPKREAIMLACASKQYFAGTLRNTGATPVLWTTNLMAPEAYTLKAALDGWMTGESGEQIRQRAAAAYAQYQKISHGAAVKLFATGW